MSTDKNVLEALSNAGNKMADLLLECKKFQLQMRRVKKPQNIK